MKNMYVSHLKVRKFIFPKILRTLHAYQKLITFIDNAEDLDTVMLMSNLLEYSGDYYITSISLWSYFRDEVNDTVNENNTDNYKTNNNKETTSKSF